MSTANALEAMLDPANYLGQSGVMVDRVLAAPPSCGTSICLPAC
jgi:hypothetical protein